MTKPAPSTPLHPLRKLEVISRTPQSLVPYANNARQHSRAQIKKIKASLRQYNWTNPVIIDQNLNVLCGHGRLQAAIELGYDLVPTIMLSDMSDADRRAYILADNVLASKSRWNPDILATEISGLLELGYEVELTGLDTIEIDTALSIGTPAPDKDEDDQVELHTGPILSHPGDLWQIGPHRLYCGDARESGSYDGLLGGELARLIFTDPPWNTPGKRISSTHGNFQMGSGELTDTQFSQDLLRPAFQQIADHSHPGAIAYVCIDWRGIPRVLEASEGVFAEAKNLIVWAKRNAGMSSFYRSQYELIYAFKVKEGEVVNNFGLGGGGRHRSNLWNYPGATSFYKGREQDLADHPTIKNKKMVADALLDCSRRGDVVLDPFAGSGTTLIAAEMTGRRGFGIELNPKFCDVALRRIAEQVGQEPLLADGTPLRDVKAQRQGETLHD